MLALTWHLVHGCEDRPGAVIRPPVDAAAHEKVRAEFVRRDEQLIDVALAITDVDASRRIGSKYGCLVHVLEPTEALFLLDRHPRRVDMPLEGARAFEAGAGPELDRTQSQRQPVRRDTEACVHQKTADGKQLAPIVAGVAAGILPGQADRLGPDPVIDELGGVMKDEDRPLGCGHAAGGCREVAGQDLSLADAIVVEEAISGLSGSPVLAGQREACSHRSAELLQEPPQPLAQPCIGKGRSGQFLVKP